ncbi:MAG: ABC transporter ATP-binding protein [Pseudomonadota bacterium]
MPFFEVKDLLVRFGGLKALNNVSFQVEKNCIYSIIGPNGAGKTTIFNCISGIYKPDQGKILFNGEDITGCKPHQIAGRGIARTFQNVELFSHMTTLDNLLLGRHGQMKTNILNGAFFTRKVVKEEITNRGVVEGIIDFLDLQSARNQLVVNLPFGTQRLVELGRALALEPEVLLLDEPSAGMNIEEKEDLMIWITDIKEDFGVTILLVEHDMKLVMEISDRVLALSYGEKITEGIPSEVQEHKEVLEAYLGEEGTVA